MYRAATTYSKWLLDVMITDGVTDVVVIVIGLLVAVIGLAQGSITGHY
jgi:hypothetical protein